MANDDHKPTSKDHRPYWENACEDFKKRLTSYALRLANGKVYDAEDLIQDTTCRALMYSPNPTTIDNPLGYLLGIMRNAWIDKWNSENTDKTVSLESLSKKTEHPAVAPDAFRLAENNELSQELSAHHGPLNEREETLLGLYLKGYKCGEIARILNEDVRLTRSDLNAVRTKVRYRLIKARGRTKSAGQR
jgi:DNA-directed RNA polymerase specialized sigma24 family protein